MWICDCLLIVGGDRIKTCLYVLKLGKIMQIKYSKHIKTRLALRKIEHDLPKRIYEKAEERYTDTGTGHTIAVMKAVIYGKERDIMVAYKHEDADVKLITIHPLKEGQKENRIRSGRWRKI